MRRDASQVRKSKAGGNQKWLNNIHPWVNLTTTMITSAMITTTRKKWKIMLGLSYHHVPDYLWGSEVGMYIGLFRSVFVSLYEAVSVGRSVGGSRKPFIKKAVLLILLFIILYCLLNHWFIDSFFHLFIYSFINNIIWKKKFFSMKDVHPKRTYRWPTYSCWL